MKTKTNERDEAGLLRFFGVLMASGVPLVQAIEPAMKRFPDYQKYLECLRLCLASSKTVSESFTGFEEGYFSGFVDHIIHAGERSDIVQAYLLASDMIDSRKRLRAAGVSKTGLDEVSFYRMFAQLIKGNYAMLDALTVVCLEFLPKKARIKIVGSFKEQGELSVALKEWPACFEPVGLSFVSVGENTGALSEACEQYAQIRERELCLLKNGGGISLSVDLLEWEHLRFLLLCCSSHMSHDKMLSRVADTASFHSSSVSFNALAKKVRSGLSIGNGILQMNGRFPLAYGQLIRKARSPDQLVKSVGRVIDHMVWILSQPQL